MANEGVFPKSDGDVLYASEVNRFNASSAVLGPIFVEAATKNDGDYLTHSATAWTKLNTTSTKITSDAGATWGDATTDVANIKYGKVSDANGALAIAYVSGNLNVAITADSGDTWTQSSADPADQPYCLSFPTATVAVLGTNKSAGARGIYFSTDAGDNWTICSTGPTVAVYAISMFSATTGFAIADGGAIWKTTDGGDNWTDTTHTTTDPWDATRTLTDIVATSATTFAAIYQSGTETHTYSYGGSGNATSVIVKRNSATNWAPLNPIILSNGNIVLGISSDTTTPSAGSGLFILDSATATSYKYVPLASIFPSASSKNTSNLFTTSISEYDTDKILLNLREYGYYLLDLSNV